MKEKNQISGIKGYISKMLREAGVDDQTLAYQIELVATDILVYRKLRQELLDESTKMVRTEHTDRGQARLRSNPLLFDLREQSKVVQKGLDMLMMNVKSKKGTKEPARDNFAEFMGAMKD